MSMLTALSNRDTTPEHELEPIPLPDIAAPHPDITLKTNALSEFKNPSPLRFDHNFIATRSPAFWENELALKKYLLEKDPLFAALETLREAGWNSTLGDVHYKQKHYQADNADAQVRLHLHKMMRNLFYDLSAVYNVLKPLSLRGMGLRVLDLCMAPGGYTAGVLEKNPYASVDAITLPAKDGGHEVAVPADPRVRILFADITMFMSELGVEEISADHPDQKRFLHERPYLGQRYDLVLADGQVLRTQKRGTHREAHEPARLLYAQLTIGLQRIATGGTLVMLLRKIDAWETVLLLRAVSRFAEVELWKPTRSHCVQSSFYMVATDVRPGTDAAMAALERFKSLWFQATFEVDKGAIVDEEGDRVGAGEEMAREFGGWLITKGQQAWDVQKQAMEKAEWVVAGLVTEK